jgi:hypothetical protein
LLDLIAQVEPGWRPSLEHIDMLLFHVWRHHDFWS